MPKLTHPDSRKQINATPEQVPMYLSQGWREVAASSTPTRKRAARKTTATTEDAAK